MAQPDAAEAGTSAAHDADPGDRQRVVLLGMINGYWVSQLRGAGTLAAVGTAAGGCPEGRDAGRRRTRGREAAAAEGLGDRFTAESGDFFAAVPGADLYLLKAILHDWDDESCLRILRNCRTAAWPGARLAVIENVVREPGQDGSPAGDAPRARRSPPPYRCRRPSGG